MSSVDDKNAKTSTDKKAKPYPTGGPKLSKHHFIHDPALEQALRLTYRLMKKYRKPLQDKNNGGH